MNFDEICLKMGMVKITMSKIPTYIYPKIQEGIELKNNIITSFRIEGTERIYGKPANPEVNRVLVELDLNKTTSNSTTNSNDQTTSNNNDVSFVNQLPSVFEGKRIIVPHDITELKKMSTFDRILLFQKTHPSIVKTKNGRGGKQSYVEGNIMKMEANIAFLFQISSYIDGWEIDEKGVSCYGHIVVDIDGRQTTVSDIGFDLQEYRKETKEPVFSTHEMMKNACTDMKKRCLSSMGFNGDVYRGEV